MTLLNIESFENLNYVQTFDPGKYGPTISSVSGRTGNAFRVVPNTGFYQNNYSYIQGKILFLHIDVNPVIFAFAVKFNTFTTNQAAFARTNEVATGWVDASGCVLTINTDRKIQIASLGGNYSSGQGTTVLTTGTWYFIEVKYYIHTSTGYITVKLNGTTEINKTGANTNYTSQSDVKIRNIILGTTYSGTQPSVDFDDFYACDTNGSVNNDFLGNMAIDRILPNDNGNSSQLVGSDGNSIDNYLLINDTDYVKSSTPGDKDLYNYGNISRASVAGIKVVTKAKKNTIGVNNLKVVIRSNTTEQDSSIIGLGSDYDVHPPIISENDPDTAAPWTVSGLNAAQFGIKVA